MGGAPTRSSRSARRRGLALALAAAPCLLVAAPAGAEQDPQQGWWTAMNPGPAAPVPAPAPLPPDVPADGLLLQAGADGPTAYAALSFVVPDGVTAGQLVLKVTPQSATTPASGLQACRLKSPDFTPAQGGPAADAPAFDCAQAAKATLSGTTYTLDASGLVSDGVLAVALLPLDASSRIVLDGPTGQDLTTSGSPSTGTGGSTSGSAGSEPASSGDTAGAEQGPAPDPGSGTAQAPALGTGELPADVAPGDDSGVVAAAPELPKAEAAPAEGAAPADVQPQAGQDTSTVDAVATALQADGGGGGRGSPARALAVLLAGALAAGAALWAFAGSAPSGRASAAAAGLPEEQDADVREPVGV